MHLPDKSGDPHKRPIAELTDFALIELEHSINYCEEKASSRDCWKISPIRLPEPGILIRNGAQVRTLGK